MIRRARPEDARGIAEVHCAAWEAAYTGLIPEEFLAARPVERRTEAWTRGLASGVPIWVAVVDRQIAGFAMAGRTRDDDVDPAEVGELWAINVAPEAWGTGVGKELLDAAVEGLRTQGYSVATLWVFQENPRARRFYEREGWGLDGATKTIEWGAKLPAVRYRRGL